MAAPRHLAPIEDRIAFAKAAIDVLRLRIEGESAWSNEGRLKRKEFGETLARVEAEMNRLLEEKFLALVERDGVEVPDHADIA